MDKKLSKFCEVVDLCIININEQVERIHRAREKLDVDCKMDALNKTSKEYADNHSDDKELEE